MFPVSEGAGLAAPSSPRIRVMVSPATSTRPSWVLPAEDPVAIRRSIDIGFADGSSLIVPVSLTLPFSSPSVLVSAETQSGVNSRGRGLATRGDNDPRTLQFLEILLYVSLRGDGEGQGEQQREDLVHGHPYLFRIRPGVITDHAPSGSVAPVDLSELPVLRGHASIEVPRSLQPPRHDGQVAGDARVEV